MKTTNKTTQMKVTQVSAREVVWKKDTHMKAIIHTQYGSPDILQFKEVEKPLPRDNEVLIKVQAASVNTLDLALRGPLLARIITGGLLKPNDPRLGVDLAGQVEAIGSNVTQFQPGDEVFGECKGAFAEYACADENKLALKPANLSFEAAAAVPVAALTALQGLRDKGQIQPGQQVLIHGASGGVGSFAVQLAKAFGAEVTALCSTRNVDQARAIGADHVIDYTQEDCTRNGQRYDMILAVNGYHPISAYRRALRPTGRFVLVGASRAHIYKALLQALLLGPVISRTGKQKMGFMGIAKINQKDLVYVKELLEAGKVAPVIEKRYPLAETAEALRYLDQGHARGKVVITVEQNSNISLSIPTHS
jgi:NADPH:quinone reductase-like Zn-dependent oxidoreductase